MGCDCAHCLFIAFPLNGRVGFHGLEDKLRIARKVFSSPNILLTWLER